MNDELDPFEITVLRGVMICWGAAVLGFALAGHFEPLVGTGVGVAVLFPILRSAWMGKP